MSLFDADAKSKVVDINGVEFNTLTIESRDLIEEYNMSNTYDKVSWENSFGFLYSYSVSRKKTCQTVWKIIDGFLCVFEYNIRSKRMIIENMPVCMNGRKRLSSAIGDIFDVLNAVNGDKNSEMFYVTKDSVSSKKSEDVLEKHKIKVSKDYCDFVFRIEDLITLKGRAYQKRRNMVHRFVRDNPNHLIRPVVKSDHDEIMNLRNEWIKAKTDRKENVWDKNMFPIELENYKRIGGRMLACEIDGKIKGFLSMFPLCKDTCVVMTRNSDNNVKGLAEFLWYECLRFNKDMGPYENDGNAGAETNGLYHYKMDHIPVALIDKVELHSK